MRYSADKRGRYSRTRAREPADLWLDYLEPRHRERAIRIEKVANGLEVLLIDGKPFEMLRGLLGSMDGIDLPGEDALVPGRRTCADGDRPGFTLLGVSIAWGRSGTSTSTKLGWFAAEVISKLR